MSRAPIEDFATKFNASSTLCAMDGLSSWKHLDDLSAIEVMAASIGDARMWLVALGDLSEARWRIWDDLDQMRSVASGFIPWRGWHVMVHAEEPLLVPASVADRLVLAGGQR